MASSASSTEPAIPAAKIQQQAFYILFDYQIENPAWPKSVCQNDGEGEQGSHCVGPMDIYAGGVIITQPMNITQAHIAKVKREVPGALMMAYWCMEFIPVYTLDTGDCSSGHIMGDRAGRNCSTTYKCTDGQTPEFNRLVNNAFPRHWAQTDLSNGTVHCGYTGQATYVPFKESAESLAVMLASVVNKAGFDGIYLDGYLDPATYGEFKTPKFPSGAMYDFNGDGKADSPQDVVKQYQTWAPYFVSQLRDLMGPDKYILSNSAGANPDPNLNGLTIEMEACLDMKECTSALVENQREGARPTKSVLWLTHSEVMSAEQQCDRAGEIQALLPFVQAGTDFFDGSHVVCNNTAAS